MKKCTNCGKKYDENSFFCEDCGTALVADIPVASEVSETLEADATKEVSAVQEAPVNEPAEVASDVRPVETVAVQNTDQARPRAAAQRSVYYQSQPEVNDKVRGDFVTAPTSVNVLSVIGFVLSFLCIAFLWVPRLSIIIFPLSIIALVFCTIVKAMRYNIIFAKVGFIVALIVTIISGIIFGIHFSEII